MLAPFSTKPFAWAAYLAYKDARTWGENVESEIFLVGGVQYSSLYSIGRGETLIFKLSDNA